MIIDRGDRIRDYVVLKKLGEGGMGSVYLANDEMLDRSVALKILNSILITDGQFVDRFRLEAKVQSSLVHPNIVSLYTFFNEGGTYCMVMEYAEGETLRDLVERTGPIPEDRALRIFRQMLQAVEYAHSKGIIHRDIKPSNIVIGREDTVKVMDFGIAKILGDKGLTRTGAKMGTLYYMSPEQIRAAKDVDSLTDVYSLGITLFEMLTGRLPFNADTDSEFEVMQQIVDSALPDPRGFYPGISQGTVDLIVGMTMKDRALRPSSTVLSLGSTATTIPYRKTEASGHSEQRQSRSATSPSQRRQTPPESEILLASERFRRDSDSGTRSSAEQSSGFMEGVQPMSRVPLRNNPQRDAELPSEKLHGKDLSSSNGCVIMLAMVMVVIVLLILAQLGRH